MFHWIIFPEPSVKLETLTPSGSVITPHLSKVRLPGKASLTVTLVALTLPVLFTTIVKLTKVLLPTTVKSAVLLTFKTTGSTVTLVLFLTSVAFSLDLTVTTLVILPACVVLTRAVTQNLTISPLFNLEMFHWIIFPEPSVKLETLTPSGLVITPNLSKVRLTGNLSVTITSVKFIV